MPASPARRLDSRVQREYVGLESNVLDSLDDLVDLARGGGYIRHSGAEVLHLRNDRFNILRGVLHKLVAVDAVLRGLDYLVGNAVDSRVKLLDRRRLLNGRLRELLGRHRHLIGTAQYLGGRNVDLTQNVSEILVELVNSRDKSP